MRAEGEIPRRDYTDYANHNSYMLLSILACRLSGAAEPSGGTDP